MPASRILRIIFSDRSRGHESLLFNMDNASILIVPHSSSSSSPSAPPYLRASAPLREPHLDSSFLTGGDVVIPSRGRIPYQSKQEKLS